MSLCDRAWQRIRHNPRTTRYGLGALAIAAALYAGADRIAEATKALTALAALAGAAAPILLLMQDRKSGEEK